MKGAKPRENGSRTGRRIAGAHRLPHSTTLCGGYESSRIQRDHRHHRKRPIGPGDANHESRPSSGQPFQHVDGLGWSQPAAVEERHPRAPWTQLGETRTIIG